MISFIRIFSVISSMLLLSACASIVDGTTQEITVDSNPKGADCSLDRNDKLLARVTTPNTITIKKTKHNINVLCSMDGYHDSTAHLKSKTQDSTWGNIVLGGGIGWAIDSARGADNKYDDYVTITMVPLGMEKPAPVTPAVNTQEETIENKEVSAATTEVATEPADTGLVVSE